MPARKRRAEAATKGWEKRKSTPDQSCLKLSSPSNRPSKLKKWSDESMRDALKAVKEGRMGANKAARIYDVPPTTLKDRLSGRVKLFLTCSG